MYVEQQQPDGTSGPGEPVIKHVGALGGFSGRNEESLNVAAAGTTRTRLFLFGIFHFKLGVELNPKLAIKAVNYSGEAGSDRSAVFFYFFLFLGGLNFLWRT